ERLASELLGRHPVYQTSTLIDHTSHYRHRVHAFLPHELDRSVRRPYPCCRTHRSYRSGSDQAPVRRSKSVASGAIQSVRPCRTAVDEASWLTSNTTTPSGTSNGGRGATATTGSRASAASMASAESP